MNEATHRSVTRYASKEYVMGFLSNATLTFKNSSQLQELEKANAPPNLSVNEIVSMRSLENGEMPQNERASLKATQPLISVVVPVFNEQNNVTHLVERLTNTLEVFLTRPLTASDSWPESGSRH